MITYRLVINKYEWAVTILIGSDCSCLLEISDLLDSILCSEELIEEAMDNLGTCSDNIGLTYSNYLLHRSVMVISKTDSSREMINTITHEVYHLVQHISSVYNLEEEELATLNGDLNMNIFDVVEEIIHS